MGNSLGFMFAHIHAFAQPALLIGLTAIICSQAIKFLCRMNARNDSHACRIRFGFFLTSGPYCFSHCLPVILLARLSSLLLLLLSLLILGNGPVGSA
jgi:hypothetical protein